MLSPSKPEQPKAAAQSSIAIVGRPNVGKSSLFNALVGRRISIVHEMPGVTRDRVVASLTHGGRRFQLIDTGGLGTLPGESRKADVWDSRIAEQVRVAMEHADVLIFVTNVRDGIVPLDEEIARKLRESGKQVLLAANKCDNPTLADQAAEFMRLGFSESRPVSCLHRIGVDALLDSAIQRLPETETVREEEKEAEEEESANSPDSRSHARNFRLAVVGRPNVGKSSLVNALLGEERVMVSETAGTTRDAIDIDFTLQFRGAAHPATLVDTAGLRKTAKVDTVVEYFSVMRAKNAIERADLIVFVVEANPDGATAQDRRIAGLIQRSGKGCVLAVNKFDLQKKTCKLKQLESELRRTLPGLKDSPLVFVSAKKSWNLNELLDRIAGVMEQLERKISTGSLNRVLLDAFKAHPPPVSGAAPLKIFYASMTGMAPPRILLFVNNPNYCADHYLAFLRNTVRNAFDLSGLPVEIELRKRPKRVMSIRSAPGKTRKRRTEKSASAAKKSGNSVHRKGVSATMQTRTK